MGTYGNTVVKWYVIFTRAKKYNWFMRRLNRDFTHVYAMRRSDGGEFWIIVESMFPYLKCSIEPVDHYPHPRVYAGASAIILPVKAHIGAESRWTLCIFNCVEVVKALLGIKKFWIFTPYQLYRYLEEYHG